MAKSRPVLRSDNKVIGYGWVGRWLDGKIGWCLPEHLTGYVGSTDAPRKEWTRDDDMLVLCKITIEVVPAKDGMPIHRSVGALRKEPTP